MKALLITADAAPVVVEVPEDRGHGGASLRELQRIVGGNIEALPFPNREDVTCYINDEGLYTKPVNVPATAMLAPLGLLGPIHGPMLIFGFTPRAGRTTACPPDLIETFTARMPT